jgi:hypothetical protein
MCLRKLGEGEGHTFAKFTRDDGRLICKLWLGDVKVVMFQL